MKRWMLTTIAVLGVAATAGAAPIQKGAKIFAIQLNEGTASLYSVSGQDITGATTYITGNMGTEIGVQAQYWQLLSDEYAFNVSGGIGFFKEKDEPGSAAPPGSPDVKYSQSSFKVRVGGDRVAHLTDRFHLFVGPGIEFWSGKSKFEVGSSSTESENTTRIAISGRIGAHLKWTDSIGMFAQLGHFIGYASAKENGAKATWWASGHDGAGGIAFNF